MAVISHNEGRRGGPVSGFVGWFVALVLLGLLFAVWALYASRPGSQLLVPAPGDVLRAFVDFFGDAAVWRATGSTLKAWVPAFLIAGIIGVAVGVAAGRGWGALLSPSLFVFAAFPIPAMATIGKNASSAPDRASRTKSVFRALEIGAIMALTGIVLVESMAGQGQIGHLLIERFTQLDTKGQFALAFWIWGLGLALALPFALGRWLAGRGR